MKKFLLLFWFLPLLFLSGCASQNNIIPIKVIPEIPLADVVQAPIVSTTTSPEIIQTPIVSTTPSLLVPYKPPASSADLCRENNGVWLGEFQECENISLNFCTTQGGVFADCGSACRHQATGTVCTLQCVPVCNLEGVEVLPDTFDPRLCGPCRAYSPPAPGWCSDGTIIVPPKDRCGCVGHLVCQK